MPAERYYYPHLFSKTSIVLDENESRHLLKVMRTDIGDTVEVVNGLGQLAIATLTKSDKKNAILEVEDILSKETPHDLILAQGMPKISHLDFIMEKGTELGMTKLILFPADRSEKEGLSPNQQERLEKLSIAALKQCGTLYKPTVKLMPKLKDWESISQKAFFGSLKHGSTPLNHYWNDKAPSNGLMIFVGPEKGFSEKEEECLLKLGADPVSLNKNILRAETAALASIALLHHWQAMS
ncbi:MAG: 16S rRNA (uracil(1498)-N(3))-methyltransferase [Parachlamydiales bacterium]|nr:16S rRNA (uracil(1498)-N(3))-methyltransferase [Parachlamydiales bacterium]